MNTVTPIENEGQARQMFPNADGVKTYKGAMKRIERFREIVGDEVFTYSIQIREDGTMIAVIHLFQEQFAKGLHFAAMDAKCCVTSH